MCGPTHGAKKLRHGWGTQDLVYADDFIGLT